MDPFPRLPLLGAACHVAASPIHALASDGLRLRAGWTGGFAAGQDIPQMRRRLADARQANRRRHPLPEAPMGRRSTEIFVPAAHGPIAAIVNEPLQSGDNR